MPALLREAAGVVESTVALPIVRGLAAVARGLILSLGLVAAKPGLVTPSLRLVAPTRGLVVPSLRCVALLPRLIVLPCRLVAPNRGPIMPCT